MEPCCGSDEKLSVLCAGFCGYFLCRNDVDDTTSALYAEADGTSFQSEQGVVAATANVLTWVELGATLTDDDLTSVDFLAAESLNAEALGL